MEAEMLNRDGGRDGEMRWGGVRVMQDRGGRDRGRDEGSRDGDHPIKSQG
jgi:hypothetical protein